MFWDARLYKLYMVQTECTTKKLFCRKFGTHTLDVHFLKSTLHTFREILITSCKVQVPGYHSALADSTLIILFLEMLKLFSPKMNF
jgi:hypothetical protein